MAKVSCPDCGMRFSEEKRLERHAKKAHPPKRKVSSNPSADFNHAFFPS